MNDSVLYDPVNFNWAQSPDAGGNENTEYGSKRTGAEPEPRIRLTYQFAKSRSTEARTQDRQRSPLFDCQSSIPSHQITLKRELAVRVSAVELRSALRSDESGTIGEVIDLE
ncbi:hypothetical protein [Leifsonia sp. TF02-11]|uniref:hypothetical protein n=1 Tax=Leifsonia sp. TF02-11 TaxID=2815212 RepID=UPI001AA15522|nr:hypothetical protein [Leifsonia sp. TF02-11]MBO1738507.1 hypothetical protein [Leifsonia sp. TF02-11]